MMTQRGQQFNLTAWSVALHVPCDKCGAPPGQKCVKLNSATPVVISWPHRGRGGW